MTITDPNSIDLVALSPDGTLVRLVVSDHLDWLEPTAHMLQLQAKLNGCFAFVESGQLDREFPAAVGRRREFFVAFAHPVPAVGLAFLEQVRSFCGQRGVEFNWEVGSA